MTKFTQDKIFKNVNQEDARILLNIMGIEASEVKIWTKELRLLDPKDYKPDIILEIDDLILIIEIQSTKVNDKFSKRRHCYVAVTDMDKNIDKDVGLVVLSTVEESKTVYYKYGWNKFIYFIFGMGDLDSAEIIDNFESKLETGEEINGEDIVLYSLVPLVINEKLESDIKRVVDNLLKVKNLSISLKELSFGIEWLIVDKYIVDEEERNILCDALGDKMSLINEYGDRREMKGERAGFMKGTMRGKKIGIIKGRREGMIEGRREAKNKIILNLVNSGMSPEEVSQHVEVPLPRVLEIIE